MDCGHGGAMPNPTSSTLPLAETGAPQLVLLDFFFPGFSVVSGALQKYLHIDINLYLPIVLLCGVVVFLWGYVSNYAWDAVQNYLMSTVEIRVDDELYNYVMAWVAAQRFAQGARQFIANTNLNSRSRTLWRYTYDDDDDDDDAGDGSGGKKEKTLAYTPSFGTHYFWYRGRLLVFRRSQTRDGGASLTVSEKEEISLCCFGRNPRILKELLHEARDRYVQQDERKTLIYRGTARSEYADPVWQRSMARDARPFSTVILDEAVKRDLVADVRDYLHPATRRWYANRGIPYRRGYLLYGPPGTGKSSLSLALAGHFKMRIYIVSLSSVVATEENLASLFADLPRRCVVLLEDIDTAGLTHTREEDDEGAGGGGGGRKRSDGGRDGDSAKDGSRLSLSGLLNILDGVASQEGRVLIMTTNHLEKLDKALIRPGRVDVTVQFDLADADMAAAIFRAIFAPFDSDECDAPPLRIRGSAQEEEEEQEAADAEKEKREAERRRNERLAEIDLLARQFAQKIPPREFSPAEIQGFLLKNKRDAARAVAQAEEWVVRTREEKRQEAEKKLRARKAREEKDKEKEKDGASETADEDETKRKKRKQRRRKAKSKKKARDGGKARHRRKAKEEDESDDSTSSLSSSSSSESEGESEAEAKKKGSRRTAPAPAEEKEGEEQGRPGAGAGEHVGAETKDDKDGIDTRPKTDAVQGSGSLGKALAAETKHGGDSGYGTP